MVGGDLSYDDMYPDCRDEYFRRLSDGLAAQFDAILGALITEAIGPWKLEELRGRLLCIKHDGMKTYYVDGIPIMVQKRTTYELDGNVMKATLHLGSLLGRKVKG